MARADESLRERRGPDRPRNGDTKGCPKCARGTIEFSERYRMTDPSGRGTITWPAWVCDRGCGYQEPARSTDRARLARATRSHG